MGLTGLICLLASLSFTNAYQISPKPRTDSYDSLPNMLTSANSFQSTEGYAIEQSQKGLPSPIELFRRGFTWQHAIDPQSPLFNGDGQWLDPTKRAECTFFADAKSSEWVGQVAVLSLIPWASQVLSIAPWILNNPDSADKYQKKMNRLLGQMAMLSRAATELSAICPRDARLSSLKSSFHDAYKGYHETLHQSEDPRTNLEQNVDTLMDKITDLATILAQAPPAFTEISPVSTTSPLSPITPEALTGRNLGTSSRANPACGTTSKGTGYGAPAESSARNIASSEHASKSEGSGGLKKLFGKGRNGKGKADK